MKTYIIRAATVALFAGSLGVTLFVPEASASAPRAEQQRAMSAEYKPRFRLLLLHFITQCRDGMNADEPPCEQNLEAHLADSDPENGFVWVLLALHEAERKDFAAALQSIRNAAQTEFYDEYKLRQIVEYSDFFATSELFGFNRPILQAIRMVLARGRMDMRVSQLCKSRAHELEWSNACLALADSIQQNGSSLTNLALGALLSKTVFEATGNEQAARAALARSKEIFELQNAAEPLYQCIETSYAHSKQWLQNMTQLGELALEQRVIEEGVSPCEPLPPEPKP